MNTYSLEPELHAFEELLGCKVFLSLFVKVKEGWRDSERTIRNWGYKDEKQPADVKETLHPQDSITFYKCQVNFT